VAGGEQAGFLNIYQPAAKVLSIAALHAAAAACSGCAGPILLRFL